MEKIIEAQAERDYTDDVTDYVTEEAPAERKVSGKTRHSLELQSSTSVPTVSAITTTKSSIRSKSPSIFQRAAQVFGGTGSKLSTDDQKLQLSRESLFDKTV